MLAARKSFVGQWVEEKQIPWGPLRASVLSNAESIDLWGCGAPEAGCLIPSPQRWMRKWAGQKTTQALLFKESLQGQRGMGLQAMCIPCRFWGWCQNPFPDVFNTLWSLIFLPLGFGTLLIWTDSSSGWPQLPGSGYHKLSPLLDPFSESKKELVTCSSETSKDVCQISREKALRKREREKENLMSILPRKQKWRKRTN